MSLSRMMCVSKAAHVSALANWLLVLTGLVASSLIEVFGLKMRVKPGERGELK
jgi:hypothetical protein